MFVMKVFVFVALLAVLINDAASMIHSLLYFETSSSQIQNFPQFVSVGYVNGLQITHFDTNTRKYEPKQEWMKKITEEDPVYWDRNTQFGLNNEQVYKAGFETMRLRLNVTEGRHMWQRMYGCEWDDETNEVNGYEQYAFDGEDFIALDLKTETFVAPRPEAVITKQRWERAGDALYYKDYITRECVEYLKKHVRNGQSILLRKELPQIHFLQKSPSSPVTCHATGFYPDRAMLFWKKDGEELYEGVDTWEMLPNHDGTFQMSTDLHLSSVPVEDWERYECVFQLSGVPDILTKLERSKIKTNAKDHTAIYIGVAVAVAVLTAVAAVVALLVKKKKVKCPLMCRQAKRGQNTDQGTQSKQSEEDAEARKTLNPDAKQ